MTRRSWKKLQEDKYLMEQKLKKERGATESSVVQELRAEGNIKGAAAVFSHEGFAWLVNQLGDIVVKKLESSLNDMLDRKILELLEELTGGLQRKLTNDEPIKQAVKQEPVLFLEPEEPKLPADFDPLTEQTKEVIKRKRRSPISRRSWTQEERQLVMETVKEYKAKKLPLIHAFQELSEVIPNTTPKTISSRYYAWRKDEGRNEQTK